MALFQMQQNPSFTYDGKRPFSDDDDYCVSLAEFGSPPGSRIRVPPPSLYESKKSANLRSFTPFMDEPRRNNNNYSTITSSSSNNNNSSSNNNNVAYCKAVATPTRTTLFSRGGDSDDTHDDSNHSYDTTGARASRCTLPPSLFDPNSGSAQIPLDSILDEGYFQRFVKDKGGCHYLQEKYPETGSSLREKMFQVVTTTHGLFEEMCKDVFANFFVQKMIELSSKGSEQKWIALHIREHMFELCMNRYSCRVVQCAIEFLDDELKEPLLEPLRDVNLVTLTVDQNANHVIQKILNSYGMTSWAFIVNSFLHDSSFFQVVENKYGCRVIQLAIELLSNGPQDRFSYDFAQERINLLKAMMERLLVHCERLSSNEFANYVIQHVITTPCLAEYRDLIIGRCLLCKLLSLSQEKYASHVVEKAMTHASAGMLHEMMDEIFDGYIPHPDTKKDALDILLFHQFGNYVVQRMLQLCLKPNPRLDEEQRKRWFARLEEKITRNNNRLLRYSSGKKILDMLNGGSHSSRARFCGEDHHPYQSHLPPFSPRLPPRYNC